MPRLTPLLGVLAVLALAAPGGAAADPIPDPWQPWPKCFTGGDDDGRYCIVSQKQNGVEIVAPSSGTWQRPEIVFMDSPGALRFGVWQVDIDGGHEDTDVPPDDAYELVVNTGSLRLRELFGNVRDASFVRGGSAATGFTFTLSFKPTPIAWVEFGSCVVGACGDETLQATQVQDGFVNGYVTNLVGSGLDAAEIAARDGYLHVHNAQDATLPFYDFDSHSLVIRLANPHLRAPGVRATGSYRTFLPTAMLTGVMNVPDPGSLTGGSVVVSRSAGGSTSSVPFSLTHVPGGVEISIATIEYSSPTYRIRPKRTRPGPPRLRSAVRVKPRSIRLNFVRPIANGGAPVTRYVGRCRTAGGKTFTASARRAPITLKRLPRAKLRCSVRAVNRIGKSPFSPERRA